MGNVIRVELDNGIPLQITIISADAFAEQPGEEFLIEEAGQCWIVNLRVSAKGVSVKGWAFMSSWLQELLFQRNCTNPPPPHFMSGKPVETEIENDLLTDLADHIDIDSVVIATGILGMLREAVFIFPNLYACGNDFHGGKARSFKLNRRIYQI